MATAIPANQRNNFGTEDQMNQNAPQAQDPGTNQNPWTSDPQQQQTPAQAPNAFQGMNPHDAFMQAVSTLGVDPRNARGNLGQITDYLNANGMPGWTNGGQRADDWVSYNGQGFDVLPSANNQWQWLDDPADSQGGGGGGTNQFNYSPWSADPREGGLFNMLMSRAQQGLNINPKDPIIANQVNAYSAEQQRGGKNYLRQLAESGGPYGNTSMEKRMVAEKGSQATGQMQAQLMQNELNSRRQEIQNALSQMGGMLTSDQQLALQKELAYLSNDEFLRSLGLQAQGQAYNQYAQQSGLGG